VNEPHAFLAAYHTIAASRLCFIEPPIGNVEKRFVIPAVTRAMRDADADGEPPFRLAPTHCNAPPNALAQRPGIIDIESVSDNNKFLATEPIGKIGHARARDHVQHDAL
jgi:hypothetical protein